jgi:hypothetical protein
MNEAVKAVFQQGKDHLVQTSESFNALSSLSTSFINSQQEIVQLQAKLSEDQSTLMSLHKETKSVGLIMVSITLCMTKT